MTVRREFLLVGLTAALAFAGCGEGGGELTELPEGEPGSAEEAAPVEVTASALSPTEIRPTLQVVGTAEPLRAADLGPQVTGRITSILVEEGSAVTERQPLARIDARQASLGASAARSQVEGLQADVARLESDLARLSPLAAAGTVPQQQVDNLRLQRDSLRAALAGARSSARSASTTVSDSTVRAPFAGIVSRIDMEVGETAAVNPPSIILRVVDLSALEITAMINEAELSLVHVGSTVAARFSALDRDFEGEVVRIAPEVDRNTRSVEIVVRVDNADGELRGGMSAELSLASAEARQALVVPADAARGLGDERRVFVVAGDRAEERTVRVRALDDGALEVLDGLSVGDRVVSPLPARLQNGNPIQLRTGETASAR